MQIISAVALYFVFWWLSLFIVLPFGRGHESEETVSVPGTVESAPKRNPMLRKAAEATVVAAILFALFWLVTEVWGLGFDDLPRIVPPMAG